jgi:glycerol-3-phosphate dehydrogenase
MCLGSDERSRLRKGNLAVHHPFAPIVKGVTFMADDKSKKNKRDRSRVAGGEDYEVQYLAEQTGLSADQARTLVRRYGNDRQKLMEEAKTMRGAK